MLRYCHAPAGLPLRRDGIPLALWNRDHQAALPDQNVYGSHPILIDVREGARTAPPHAPGSPLSAAPAATPHECAAARRLMHITRVAVAVCGARSSVSLQPSTSAQGAYGPRAGRGHRR